MTHDEYVNRRAERDTIRQMLKDWDSATDAQRAEALRIAAGIAEAREHDHPTWSHAVAYGPCTLPSLN
jgi:hypothetical protein